MNDSAYFLEYKQSFQTLYAATVNEYAFLKDANLKFQAISRGVLELFAIDDCKQLFNFTSAEVAAKLKLGTQEVAQQFQLQDVQIKEGVAGGTFLEVLTINGRSNLFIINKVSITNPETGNFIGIRGQLSRLIWPHAVKTLLAMHGAKGLLLGQPENQDAWKKYPLSNMQHMILFLGLNNYSYSEIAILLNEFGYEVTPIRVNDYLEQLKFIFHVRNKTQLIEKAIGLNFHVFLPDGLFNKFNSVEVSNQTATIICCDCQQSNCLEHV